MTSFTDVEQKVISSVHIEYGEDIHPSRDWFALLVCFAVLFLASILWNAFTYFEVANSETATSENTSVLTVDTKAIDTARAVFQKRATEETNYRGIYQFIDPSK